MAVVRVSDKWTDSPIVLLYSCLGWQGYMSCESIYLYSGLIYWIYILTTHTWDLYTLYLCINMLNNNL